MNVWRGLIYVGASGMVLFFTMAFYCLNEYEAGMLGFVLGLNGMAVMALFTVLCAIASRYFGEKDKRD